MAAFGLRLSDYADSRIEVFPENELAVSVFRAVGTQWRVGINGATGLDYNVLPEIWRRLRVPMKERDSVFADLQILEGAALEEMRKK